MYLYKCQVPAQNYIWPRVGLNGQIQLYHVKPILWLFIVPIITESRARCDNKIWDRALLVFFVFQP